ncbi:MAG: BatD family protein [Desulfamplus sp.]|nr:BatD family protein [Desulfamplus sp.]
MKFNSLNLYKLSNKLSKIFFIFILIISLLEIVPVNGFCFNVTAQVDRNRISINDSVVLSIVFEDGEKEVDTSQLTDFTIVSQSSSSSISIINGKYSKFVTAIYSLIPKSTGTLKIPPFKVEHDNKIYTTKEISIEVSEQAVNRTDKESKDIFVESGISSTSLFTGQQAVYQLRFYSAVKFSNATLKPPSFKGFIAKEAGERKNYTETINGRAYHVSEVNYILIPETAGKLEIDPAIIICEVPVRRNNRNAFSDPFDDPFFSNGVFSFGRTETRQFKTDPLLISVEPLPSYPVNTSDNIPFSGLVGNFSIEANLDNHKLKAGDSATLTLTISGKGNIMDAQSPSVSIPSEFKVYDDSPEETIELGLEGYSGKKVFKKAIVPVKSGKYTIEPVKLSFFNLVNRKYETIKTNSIEVEVDNSAEQIQENQNILNQGTNNLNSADDEQSLSKDRKVVKKRQVEFTGKDILSIKEDANILVSKKRLSFSMFVILFFLPGLIFFLFRMAIAISKREVSASEAMLKKAKMSLKAASDILTTKNIEIEHNLNSLDKKSGDNREEFFKHLYDSLIAIVISKKFKNSFTDKYITESNSTAVASTAITAITADEIVQILTNAGSSLDIANEVTSLLNEIDSARYGRLENKSDYKKSLFEKVQKLFQTVCVLVIAISAFLFSFGYPLKIYANESGNLQTGVIFLEGIKAYHNGDFEDAAKKFSAIVQGKKQAITTNPYLYYNIGNAYIKAGDVGRAILWYERANKEIPLDPDLRFNLQYARGFVIDKVETGDNVGGESGGVDTGIDISELLFFWKDYFPPQMVQYGAIILSCIFFAYSGVRVFRRRKVFTPAGVAIFVVFLIAGCTSFYTYYSNYSNHFAVIISKEASIRSGNSKDATQLFILHSGTKVKVEEIKGNYLKIYFSKDKIGWVSSSDAEII